MDVVTPPHRLIGSSPELFPAHGRLSMIEVADVTARPAMLRELDFESFRCAYARVALLAGLTPPA